MTIDGISDPACRGIRLLLGVYVVGAIDPAERAIVDEHLGQCSACRDELASLAGLPAMLSRVPAADLEQLGLAPAGLPEMAEPPDEVLSTLLRRVSVRRRSGSGAVRSRWLRQRRLPRPVRPPPSSWRPRRPRLLTWPVR